MSSDINAGVRRGRGILVVALTALVVVSAVAAGVSLTAAGVASASPTGIDECTTIDTSGAYELTSNVTSGGVGCIEIAASDVTLDGDGHTVEAEGYAIRSDTAAGVENVTIRDVRVSANEAILLRNVTDAVVANATLGSVGRADALVVSRSRNVTLRDSVIEPGAAGIHFLADDSAVVDTRIGETTYGSSISGNDTVVRNNTVVGALGIHGGNANTLVISVDDSVVADNTITGGNVLRLYVGGTNTTVRNNTVTGQESDSDYYNTMAGMQIYGTNNTVVGNDVSRHRDWGISLGGSNHTVHDNVAVDNGVGIRVDSRDSLIYDNQLSGEDAAVVGLRYPSPDPDGPPFASGYRPNAWNVSERSGTNIVGGPTVGGNFYAGTDTTGFSEACADGDGVCDFPNALAANNTDYLPLADDENASVAYFEVSDVDAPERFETDEAATVSANVTNVGTETATQTVTLTADLVDENEYELETIRRTVTLNPGETTTVSFDVAFAATDPDESPTVATANSSLTQPVTVVEGDGASNESNVTYYQVDFVAGQPIQNLSADRLYGQQNRLFTFSFGNTDTGITERHNAWENASLRECVDDGSVVSHDGGDTAHVHFTVAEECENVTLSLVAYSMPGEEFDVETVDQQELLNATTGTYGPGGHTITVDLPDGDENESAD